LDSGSLRCLIVMDYIDPTYKDIAEVLSDVYRKVSWKEFTSKKKDSATAFAERLTIAGRMASVPKALDQLARGLGLSAYSTNPDGVVKLQQNAELVLERMTKESSLLALQAQVLAKEWFAAHRKEESE
jgi:hypothetical protein